VIVHGLPIYVALEPVDMRLGYERLGGIVRERMQAEPRSRALFVFVGKRGHTMKVLTWDGTGDRHSQEARCGEIRATEADVRR
jgi:transposase